MTARSTTIGWRCDGALFYQELAEREDVEAAARSIRNAAGNGGADLLRAIEDAMAAGFAISFSDGDMTVHLNL